MKRCCGSLTLGILAAMMGCVQLSGAPGPVEPPWVEVRSPNFTVVSPASAREAARVAQQFEQIREAIRRVLPGMSLDPGQPILILAVRDERELSRLIPEYWEERGRARPAGIFLRGPERHFVALRLNVGGDRPFQTIYHEYLHLLVSLNFPGAPLWVNEGLAEFYANTQFGEADVVFGLPSRSHVSYLRREPLLPLETLFAVDEGSPYYNQSHQVSIFYSQSWALVHYLLTRDSNREETPLDRFLFSLSEGADPSRAVAALGDLGILEEELKHYVHQDNFYFFRYPEPIAISTEVFSERRLEAGEAKAIRASFLIGNQRPREAEALVAEAIAENPELPLAFETLGYLRFVAGRPKEAREAFARAVALGSESYLSHYFLGFLDIDAADSPESIRLAEASLRRAIRLRPNFPFAYTALATLLMRRGDDQKSEALRLAREACRLEPNNGRLLQTLAYALAGVDRLEEAEKVLAQIYLWAGSASDLELARRVEASLTQFRDYWQKKHEYDRQVREMEHELAATGRARSSRRTREAEGTVRAVSCSAPASMEIVLDTGKQEQLRLTSRNFSAVQFFFAREKPADDFHPCRGLQGRVILASYQPDPIEDLNRLVSVRLR